MKGGIIIYKNFISLNEEKKERILNAAYGVFGKYGYAKSSVEEIARAAEISKSMVFHYFGNKKGLFEYLIVESTKFVKKFMNIPKDELEKYDYIEQYRFLTKIKLEVYLMNPKIFEFLGMFYLSHESIEINSKVMEEYLRVIEIREKIFQLVENSENTEMFRKDLEKEHIKNYISWIIEGYSNKLINYYTLTGLSGTINEEHWKEFDEILDELKIMFYVG